MSDQLSMFENPHRAAQRASTALLREQLRNGTYVVQDTRPKEKGYRPEPWTCGHVLATYTVGELGCGTAHPAGGLDYTKIRGVGLCQNCRQKGA